MSEQDTIKELERLSKLYYERKAEFDKASKTRWILAFIGFVLVFSFVLIRGNIKSLFSADIKSLLMALLAVTVATGFYFFVNISIFGWLFQKDIAEGRRLDDIEKRISELEKTLK